ncbi:MAG: polysaccharide pyruvyl transferase family protein, partial [Propionibacteriaceae bacterium]|nr:polysaccharide pyruvyl transferase family protein [Propionibacteriaceae bacterium]
PLYRQVSPIDFLTFAQERQRVAYAASFGVPEIPAPYRSRYAGYLRGIPHISVREGRAAEIVAELTGRDVPVVLDPTLLLTAEDWSATIGERRAPDEDYLLTFFLTELTGSESAEIARHAAANGLAVVDPLDPSSVPEPLSPLGFIDLIRGASAVATDSFHASVFSVLFHRPLILKGRDAMESRTETLLGSLGLTLGPWAPLPHLNALTEPDWLGAEARLATHRKSSTAYLEASLG